MGFGGRGSDIVVGGQRGMLDDGDVGCFALAKSCRFYLLRLYAVKSMMSENEDLLRDQPGSLAYDFLARARPVVRSSSSPEYSEPEGETYRMHNDWCV